MRVKLLSLIILQGVLFSCEPVELGQRPGSSGASRSGGASSAQLYEAKSRPKRCTCYSYKDKECVYYCHLDIIWINTPERTVPYGMSSYQGLQRVRRAVGGRPAKHEGPRTQRCICVVPAADPECRQFCLSPSLQTLPTGRLHQVPGPG